MVGLKNCNCQNVVLKEKEKSRMISRFFLINSIDSSTSPYLILTIWYRIDPFHPLHFYHHCLSTCLSFYLIEYYKFSVCSSRLLQQFTIQFVVHTAMKTIIIKHIPGCFSLFIRKKKTSNASLIYTMVTGKFIRLSRATGLLGCLHHFYIRKCTLSEAIGQFYKTLDIWKEL
jgi:hypothetical protein